MQPIGIHQRMALGGDDLNVFHADAPKFGRHEVGSLLDVGFVLLQSADARNAKQIL